MGGNRELDSWESLIARIECKGARQAKLKPALEGAGSGLTDCPPLKTSLALDKHTQELASIHAHNRPTQLHVNCYYKLHILRDLND